MQGFVKCLWRNSSPHHHHNHQGVQQCRRNYQIEWFTSLLLIDKTAINKNTLTFFSHTPNHNFLSLEQNLHKRRHLLHPGDGSKSWTTQVRKRKIKQTKSDRRDKQQRFKEVQSMWLYYFLGKDSNESHENTPWRKVKQMQPMWLCIHSSRRIEETFVYT